MQTKNDEISEITIEGGTIYFGEPVHGGQGRRGRELAWVGVMMIFVSGAFICWGALWLITRLIGWWL